jgi:glycosyltransferase involved in cell wall biosynthesis
MTRKLNIWLVAIGENLPLEKKNRKQRTSILADKLMENNHEVLWWTSAFNHYQKKWLFKGDTTLKINNLTIKALKGVGYKKNVSIRRLVDHRLISWKFRKIAPKMSSPDVVIASTPSHDLAYEAVRFSRENDIPVLVDIRDEWPDLFLNVFPKICRRFIRILLTHDFQMIKKALSMADGLVAMMDSLLEWGLNYVEREKNSNDRVFYLGDKRKSVDIKEEEKYGFLNSIKEKFVVAFVGTFVQSNNPSILIDCAEKLRDRPVHFVLAGNGELFNQIKKKAAPLPNVLLPGWLNQNEMAVLLKNSHVGVCPTTKARKAFPNKAFSYLSAGLPIISAFHGDIKETIEKYQIGFYYQPNDKDALINWIKKLYEDQGLYKKMAENARKVFDEMFDADKIYASYAEHIEKIAEMRQIIKR